VLQEYGIQEFKNLFSMQLKYYYVGTPYLLWTLRKTKELHACINSLSFSYHVLNFESKKSALILEEYSCVLCPQELEETVEHLFISFNFAGNELLEFD